MVAGRTALRLVLLTLVAAGVAGMHTLGHPSSGHASDAHATDQRHASSPPIAAPMSPGSAPEAPYATGIGVDLDPSEVCLAILSGLGVAALLAALLAAHPGTRLDQAGSGRAAAAVSRGPPDFIWYGLRLADLSVQRT